MQPDPAWTAGSAWSAPQDSLHGAVADIASVRPQARALICGSRILTYGELDQLAAAWSASLSDAGLSQGDLVPIVLPRGIEMVIALLAVLKAGCAYALLDPSWPPRRLAGVISQLASPVMIAQTAPAGVTLPKLWSPSLHPPGPTPAGKAEPASRALVPGADPCCVFFTSGTTGRPKGVICPHQAIMRLFGQPAFANFGPDTVIPLAAPAAWDAFSLELFAALLSGGTSVVIEEPYLSANALRQSVARAGVNTVWLTSSLFNMIVDEDLAAFGGLRQVMTGGERLSPTHVRRFITEHGDISLLNGYGPVESTIFTTTHEVTADDCDRHGGIPLGRPVPGTQIFVLDGLRPCAVGEEGEICIGGDGLAVGYLGDPALTEAKFPQLTIDGGRRLYRSGDLGAWAPEGLLEYRGRMDRQVKLRGHRIEPGHIEYHIEQLPAIRLCRLVAARDDSGAATDLFAFCVPAEPGDQLAGIKTALGTLLAPHERPSAVISVPRFPLTDQGKLDERALLALLPQPGDTTSPRSVPWPDGTLHALVAETFAELLERAWVPPDASFFALGGSSLAAGALCARIGARLSRPISVARLYEYPTVAAFGDWLASAPASPGQAEPAGLAAPASTADQAPLTSMQLVFLTRQLSDPSDRTSHCLMIWQADGDLSLAGLQTAIDYVHDRHEALRAAYVPDPTPAAVLVEIDPPELEVMPEQPSVQAAAEALRAEFAEPLEIMEGEVWRFGVVPVAGSPTSVLGCVVHHIAFDGWSEAVLAADLSIGYRRRPGSTRPPAPSLASVARQRAEHQRQANLAARTQAVSAYLADTPELRWPGRPASARPEPGRVHRQISTELLAGLDAAAERLGVTRFVVLLAAWGSAVAEVTGQNDFAAGVPSAQRDSPLHEQMVGCFLEVVCVRLRAEALAGGLAGIEATSRTVTQAFANQDVPFTDVLDLLGPNGSHRPPVFQVLFALQDTAPPRLELSGLQVRLLPQPYLDLPLELHTEIWPDGTDGMRVVVSYRPEMVDASTAESVATIFMRNLVTTAREVAPA
jgi:mycobactin peptide synthetase MbtE